MRALITGATGYLGSAMLESVPADIEAIPAGFSRGDLAIDVTDARAVHSAIERHRPDVLIHLAAVSVVASATADPAVANAVNVGGARTVGAASGQAGVRLVALSSDVVFDGTEAPYAEDAIPRPINEYGVSKLAGETALATEHPQSLILRTSVLVGRDRADRNPFSAYVLERARAGHQIPLFENERRNFFPVTIAAAAVWECAAAAITGILHIGAITSMSRFEFGQRLLAAAGFDPGLAIAAEGPPDRPSDLTLVVDRAQELLNTPMPSMDDVITEVRRDLMT